MVRTWYGDGTRGCAPGTARGRPTTAATGSGRTLPATSRGPVSPPSIGKNGDLKAPLGAFAGSRKATSGWWVIDELAPKGAERRLKALSRGVEGRRRRPDHEDDRARDGCGSA